MDDRALQAILAQQAGVIARRQIIDVGDDHVIARPLRRRLLSRVHDGVFINHTGPRSEAQATWAAAL